MDEGQRTDPNADRGAAPRAASRDTTAGAGTGDKAQWFQLGKDPYAVTGPPPAFEANVLEADRDFQRLLARLDAERAAGEAKLLGGDGPQARTGTDGGAASRGGAGQAEAAHGTKAATGGTSTRAFDWLEAAAEHAGSAAQRAEPRGKSDTPGLAETETAFGNGEGSPSASGAMARGQDLQGADDPVQAGRSPYRDPDLGRDGSVTV